MENFGFCPHCGMTLDEGAFFCPSCGMDLYDTGAHPSVQTEDLPSFRWARMLIGLFSVATILFALYMLLSVDSIMELYQDPQYSDLVYQYFSSMEEFRSALILTGYYILAGGLLAAIPFGLCVIRRFWMLALVSTLFVSLFMIVLVPCTIVGLIVTYLVYSSKPAFRSDAS